MTTRWHTWPSARDTTACSLHVSDGTANRDANVAVDGELSRQFFHRIVDVLERCIPMRERITIPGASRNVVGDNAKAYDDAVLAFLGRY